MAARNITERETRYSLIDPDLRKAGWNLSDRTQVGFEIPISTKPSITKPSRFPKPGRFNESETSPEGITDYCLYRANGEVLAVVEAKRTSRDARVGQEQVKDYVTRIGQQQSFVPFAFMANGQDVFFWDVGESARRHVAGFFSRDNLERLLFLKQNHQPLHSVPIKPSIVNRAYQAEAIRRISEAIEKKKKRKALLVMATGTGKTRTTMALIDVFLQAKWAQKILFLADRDALVKQAMDDGFKVHIPNESRIRIRSYEIERNARVYVSTLQTLETCYEQFTPADFDLIIADECHRSIYNKFTDVLAYFDAIQIGLTATPAEFVDRDTFRFFECDNSTPTFLYTFDKAVEEKYLVPYNVYSAQTRFQRQGIKGIDLSEEEQASLRQQGIDPEHINFEGTELEKKVTNRDTLRHQWEEFMDICLKDSTGQFPGKSIVFAITHEHAIRLEETFNEMYPEHKGSLARVIDSKTERARDLLDQFKKQDLPRIAISVDMLDTGVDMPEVVNLAFMKPVGSYIKFWQMIGRGTRNHETCRRYHLLPGGIKEYFLIVDFLQNFEHFNEKIQSGDAPAQIPILVSIFNTRLAKLENLLGDQASEDFKRIVKDLRHSIAQIPRDSFTVKKNFREVQDAWENEFWTYLTTQKIEFLRMRVGPLLRYATGGSPAELFFTSKMERLGLAALQHKDVSLQMESIREDVSALPTNMDEVKTAQEHIHQLLSGEFPATLPEIDKAKEALAPLMRYKIERVPGIIRLDLDDIIESGKWVIINKTNERVYVAEYKKRVEARIEELARTHPTIQKLTSGAAPGLADLELLEATLESAFTDLSLDEENMLKAFGVRPGNLIDFLKHVLHLEALPSYETIVRKAFDAFILEHNYNADQSRFLRTVQSVFLQRRKLDQADLYEEPFTNLGVNAVEKLFDKAEVEELIELTRRLVA